jgi:hypothetical protein
MAMYSGRMYNRRRRSKRTSVCMSAGRRLISAAPRSFCLPCVCTADHTCTTTAAPEVCGGLIIIIIIIIIIISDMSTKVLKDGLSFFFSSPLLAVRIVQPAFHVREVNRHGRAVANTTTAHGAGSAGAVHARHATSSPFLLFCCFLEDDSRFVCTVKVCSVENFLLFTGAELTSSSSLITSGADGARKAIPSDAVKGGMAMFLSRRMRRMACTSASPLIATTMSSRELNWSIIPAVCSRSSAVATTVGRHDDMGRSLPGEEQRVAAAEEGEKENWSSRSRLAVNMPKKEEEEED